MWVKRWKKNKLKPFVKTLLAQDGRGIGRKPDWLLATGTILASFQIAYWGNSIDALYELQ